MSAKHHLRLIIAAVLTAVLCATAWGFGASAQAAELTPAARPTSAAQFTPATHLTPAVHVTPAAHLVSAARPAGARAGYVQTCGFTTCSVYLSRSDTNWLNWNIYWAGGGVAGLAASCGLLSAMTGPAVGVVIAACAAGIAVYGGAMLNAIYHAANDNGCLRVRYYPNLPGIYAFYDDHSRYCHDV